MTKSVREIALQQSSEEVLYKTPRKEISMQFLYTRSPANSGQDPGPGYLRGSFHLFVLCKRTVEDYVKILRTLASQGSSKVLR